MQYARKGRWDRGWGLNKGELGLGVGVMVSYTSVKSFSGSGSKLGSSMILCGVMLNMDEQQQDMRSLLTSGGAQVHIFQVLQPCS